MDDAVTDRESLFCCPAMEQQATRECAEHERRLDCVDTIIHHAEIDGESVWGIPIHDGGHSWIAIRYCPWCGRALA